MWDHSSPSAIQKLLFGPDPIVSVLPKMWHWEYPLIGQLEEHRMNTSPFQIPTFLLQCFGFSFNIFLVPSGSLLLEVLLEVVAIFSVISYYESKH